ncbi:MAG: tryptophan synthase subunit alpha [Firmicutes bacterium]|nr:tryptophan synthase subunit alpha [Bacillota bacterium]
MTQRGARAIESRLFARRENKQAAFIPFVVAGDPDFETSLRIILELAAFSDVIEIGIPYSDPLADGPVIQEGALRALHAGMTLPRSLELMRRVREKTDVPLIAFTYVNPVVQYGPEKLAQAVSQAGGDGFIVPDLPFEESDRLREAAQQEGLALIPLMSLTSKRRIDKIVKAASGFVYCVSSLGVTGERAGFADELQSFVEAVKQASRVPVAVGFGVSQPQQVAELSAYSDGVIVGSAIVRRTEAIASALNSGDEAAVTEGITALVSFCKSLAIAGQQS